MAEQKQMQSVKIPFNADTGNAMSNIKKLSSQIALTIQEARQSSISFKVTSNVDDFKKSISSTKDAINLLQERSKLLGSQLKEVGNTKGIDSNAYIKLNKQLVTNNTNLLKQRAYLKDYESQLKSIDTSKFDQLNSKLRQMGSFTKQAAGAMGSIKTIAFGEVLGRGISAAIGQVRNLTGEMVASSNAQNLFTQALESSGKITSQQIKVLSQQANDFADKSVYGLDEIMGTTRTLAALGQKNAEQVTEALGDMSSATGGNFTQLSDIIRQTAASGRFQWEDLSRGLEQSPETFSLIAKASGETMNQFVQNVKNGKVSWDQLSKAIIKADSEKGVQGMAEKTITLGQAFQNLEASVVRIGIDFMQMISPSAMKAVNSFADSISNTWGILKDMAKGDAGGLTKALGISDADANTMISNFNSVKAQVFGQFSALKKQIGNSALDIGKALGISGDRAAIINGTVRTIGNGISQMIGFTTSAIKTLTPTAAALAPILMKVLDFASNHAGLILATVTAFSALKSVMGGLVVPTLSFLNLIKNLGIALPAIGVESTIAFLPLIGTIGGVALAIGLVTVATLAVVKNFNKIKDVTNTVITPLKGGFTTLGNVMKTAFTTILSVTPLGNIVNLTKGVLDLNSSINKTPGVANRAKSSLTSVFQKRNIIKLAVDTTQAVSGVSRMRTLINGLKTAFSGAYSFISSQADRMGIRLPSGFTNAINKVKNGLNGLKNSFTGFFSNILSSAENFASKLWQRVVSSFKKIGTSFKNSTNSLLSSVGLGSRVTKSLSSMNTQNMMSNYTYKSLSSSNRTTTTNSNSFQITVNPSNNQNPTDIANEVIRVIATKGSI